SQVWIHLLHRISAVVVTIALITMGVMTLKYYRDKPALMGIAHMLGIGVVVQFLFGVLTVFSARAPAVASVHVVTGALLLGLSLLFALRCYPLQGTAERAIQNNHG